MVVPSMEPTLNDFIAAEKKFFGSGETDSLVSSGDDNNLIHKESPFVYV